MKLVYVTDLHGCEWKYDRLLDIVREVNAEILINGGDLFPNDDLFAQDTFISGYFDDHLRAFDDAGIYYLTLPGNDDLRIFDPLFAATCENYPHAINLQGQTCEINGFEFLGMNLVADYPFLLKDRCRMDTADAPFPRQPGVGLLSTPDGWQEIEDWFAHARTIPTLADELEQLPRPQQMSRAVYVIHMPPSRLGLDVCGDSTAVGSHALHNFLATHQPRLSLHGHIHESPATSGHWQAHLGNTHCIQPGQESQQLTCVTIDLETMHTERHFIAC